MTTVIVKNNTSSAIFLDDLGCEIPGSGQRNITDNFEKLDISSSEELKGYVYDGTFTINDGTNDLNIADGLRHINFETEHEDFDGVDVYDGGSYVGRYTELNFSGTEVTDSTAGIHIEVPVLETVPIYTCQARRTTILVVPTSWTDITFDTTDEETDSDVIEHDTTNTDRILIKEDGLYEIDINTTVRTTTNTKTTWYRLRINDTTVVPGSEFDVDLYQDETHELSRSVTVTLSDEDYITLQMYSESNGGIVTLHGSATIIVKALSGTKGIDGKDGIDGIDGEDGLPGEPGPPGSGSTINVFEEEFPVASLVEVLNFEGRVSVTQDSTSTATIEILDQPFEVKDNDVPLSDSIESINFKNLDLTLDSTSEVTVNAIFGSEFHEASSDGESSTTSTSYQQKLRLTTSNLPSDAKYRIGWYYEWQYSDRRNDFRARVQINDSDTIMEQQQEPKDEGSDQWHTCSGFAYTTESGILNIDLDYNSSSSSDTSSIRRVKLELWRVS